MDEASYQAKVRSTATPAVYLILRDDFGQILLALRKNTGYQDGKWELPSGHVDGDELPSEAMVREAKEEIGVSIEESDLRLVHTSYRPAHDRTGNRVDLVFLCTKWTNEPVICEPEKCGDLRWYSVITLPDNMVPHVLLHIQDWQKAIPYSELTKDWLKANGLYQL